MPRGRLRKVYDEAMVARVSELYLVRGMSQVEVAGEMGTTLRVIYKLMVNHQIPRRPQVKREQHGSSNSTWRATGATYAALHKRVEVARGRPSECSVCGAADDRRYEWANLTGRYEDTTDYARMCVHCHRQYDKDGALRGRAAFEKGVPTQ